MTCSACGEQPKNTAKDFTKAVIEINNPETLVLFRKVVIPTSMGDETAVPAAVGKYHNVLLVYEANNHAYLYSSDGIPTLLTSDVAQDLEEKINKVADDLQTETANRQGADNELSGRINTLDYNIGVVAGDLSAETINRTNADKTLQDNIDAEALARSNADIALDGRLTTVEGIAATAVQPADINRVVSTDLALDPTISTSTVQLNESKVNLATGVTSSDNVVLPVASSTQAGIMNASTFDAITTNRNNLNALLSGSVAVTGLSASPSQSDLTTAWQTETGLTTLINRASVYDVTNDKVWTYYSNDQTWHAASNTTQVTINTFTNSSEGTILGSTNTGQIFAENDGTGSVNGWDTLTGNVSTNTNNIGSLQTAVAGKQDALTAGDNITIASNVISATDTTYTAGNAITIDAGDNNRIDAAIYPADFFTANATATTTADSILSFTNALNAQFKDVKLYGDSEQQTYTGRNLFNATLLSQEADYNTYNSTTGLWTTSDLGGYHRSIFYDATGANSNRDVSKIVGPLTANTTYTVKFYDFVNNTVTTSRPLSYALFHSDNTLIADSGVRVESFFTFTTPAEVCYLDIRRLESTGTFSFSKIMIAKGEYIEETFPSYEPYVGGTPSPNPDYPQAINVVTGTQTVTVSGKNLWSLASSYTNSNTTNSWVLPDTAMAIPSGNYVFSCETANTNNVQFSWKYADDVSHSSYFTNGKTSVTFTEDVVKVAIRMQGPNSISNIQLERGSTSTTYEPYQSQSYTVDLGSIELCKIGTYQDYIYKSGDDWYVHKDLNKITFNGSENWTGTSGKYAYSDASIKTQPLGADEPPIAVSNYLVASNYSAVVNDLADNIIAGYYNGGQLRVRVTGFVDSSAWTTWLTTHNMTVYYALATPTDTEITDADLISDLNTLASGNTYDGETNIIITATGTNLPALLKAEYYSKTLEGIVETIPQAQVQADWTQVDTDAKDYIKNKPTLATVATTGAYSDLIGTPTIPTVNNATLTIQTNGTTVNTFTANASSDVTANITVPVITMTDTDPGEGSPLAANNFIAIYNAS